MLHAKSGVVTVEGGAMEYIRFGSGGRALVMLPGLGTSLRSIRGTEKAMPPGYSTRAMARDQAQAMEELGIEQAEIFGVSMGGMIAQWLAIDFPEMVGRLVLAATCPRPNPVLQEAVGEWMSFARAGDHALFMDSNLRLIYSEGYYRRNRWLTPVIGLLTKPKSYEPFFIQANACLTHDAWEKLPEIKAKTLVIGGEQDHCLGGEASREIAERIPGAALQMYEQWGHGVYEEERGFNGVVLEFLKGGNP